MAANTCIYNIINANEEEEGEEEEEEEYSTLSTKLSLSDVEVFFCVCVMQWVMYK